MIVADLRFDFFQVDPFCYLEGQFIRNIGIFLVCIRCQSVGIHITDKKVVWILTFKLHYNFHYLDIVSPLFGIVLDIVVSYVF